MSDQSSDRIIVGVDGSSPSEAAIRWAAGEASMRNVDLTMLHVLTPGVPIVAMGYAMTPLPPSYEELQQERGERVLQTARRIAEEAVAPGARLRIQSELVTANPTPTLIDATKEAQMIVVGSRGQGAWRRALCGSVSTGLIHHAHCPVAVIHDGTDVPARSEGSVVVGVDGSPASELATAIAFDEASRRGVDLVALHAWSDAVISGVPVGAWPDFQPMAEQTLAERLAGWTERYPEVVVQRRVVFDRPAHNLLDAADSAQLLVVGSHGRGGFAGMVLGSVSSTIVHEARTPVIVARQG